MTRASSRALTGSLPSKGVPATATSALMGTLSGCSGSVASCDGTQTLTVPRRARLSPGQAACSALLVHGQPLLRAVSPLHPPAVRWHMPPSPPALHHAADVLRRKREHRRGAWPSHTPRRMMTTAESCSEEMVRGGAADHLMNETDTVLLALAQPNDAPGAHADARSPHIRQSVQPVLIPPMPQLDPVAGAAITTCSCASRNRWHGAAINYCHN